MVRVRALAFMSTAVWRCMLQPYFRAPSPERISSCWVVVSRQSPWRCQRDLWFPVLAWQEFCRQTGCSRARTENLI